MADHAFEQVESRDGVGAHVDVRVLDACPDSGAGGEVDDRIEAVVGEDPVEGLTVLDIDLVKSETVVAEQRLKPVTLQSDVIVVIQIVEADDFVTCIEGQLGGLGSDEACAASDQDALGHFSRGLEVGSLEMDCGILGELRIENGEC